jgi:hypothetical protein
MFAKASCLLALDGCTLSPFGIGNAMRRRGGCWNVSLLIYPE